LSKPTDTKETASGKKTPRSKFHPLFWLVIIFEFFERGSYYGVMSVLSVYLTDHLHFAKTDVGLIKSTIQPLLYFLPIISGALADRFGYRRTLLVAFSLLGGGYLLTAQATGYATVFLSLVVMGIGAGTFKPVISGSIARCTDETNSTLGFGIFYWTINLGAFLVPLILVPYLKNNIGWNWVIIAAGLGTGAMLLPTLFLFREPPKPPEDEDKPQEKKNLLLTVANAFEILYSPVVLLSVWMRRSAVGVGVAALLILGTLSYGIYNYAQPGQESYTFAARQLTHGEATVKLKVVRNLFLRDAYSISDNWGFTPFCRIQRRFCTKEELAAAEEKKLEVTVTLNQPEKFKAQVAEAAASLRDYEPLQDLEASALLRLAKQAQTQSTLRVVVDRGAEAPFALAPIDGDDGGYQLTLQDEKVYRDHEDAVRARLGAVPAVAALTDSKLDELVGKASSHDFLVLFVALILLLSLLVIRLAPRLQGEATSGSHRLAAIFGVVALMGGILWLLPYLSLFTSILCTFIGLTVLSLFVIDTKDTTKFLDHGRFLLMIFLYSGFWVLYFQMFDSVLWYVKAYVDATGLNEAVNSAAAALGIEANWRFDIEHVTVINAGTIIALQLIISNLVKNTRAMPTMITGITMGTIGMAILAISTGIWTFMAGIVIFSIGEMTAHPKFIAYVGQTAPKARVAMYMGYLFLYGVIGASIGGVLGANLYVEYVDRQNDPQSLWLIFTGIGLATIVGLLLYNRFLGKKPAAQDA